MATTQATAHPLVEMQGITKYFNGVKAIQNISFKLRRGTVHAVMGENGAGKSTTMKILTGIYKPDSGTILVDGQEVHFSSPKAAIDCGISIIHQELSPVLEMSIAENVFLGREPKIPGTPFIHYKRMYRETKDMFRALGLDMDPKRKMKELSISETQMVEIVKAVSYNSKVIIMDEPTSSLADKEVEQLFKIIHQLRSEGKGILYISHKMEEIFKISDDITVFRDGEYISTNAAKDLTQSVLIKQMVGRELTEVFPERKKALSDEVVLEVNELSAKGYFQNINFQLKKGEILGLTGLMGAGRTELVKALFGLLAYDSGTIKVNNKTVRIKEPKDAIAQGLALVTEDRKGEGLVLPMSVKANMTLPTLRKVSSGLFINRNDENKTVDELMRTLAIKASSKNQRVETLSGGNQQKIVLAKWLLTNPQILILDEPTRGIDIGAKSEIYKLMDRLTQEGYSIIMISSEMPEVLGTCDRIIVLCEGRITGILDAEEATQEKILSLATPDKMEE